MNRYWYTASLLIAAGVASTASAKELKFVFDVRSSGPEIYPCDAGLVHARSEGFCHYKGTTETCNWGLQGQLPTFPIPPSKIFDNRLPNVCVCTNGEYGTYLKDFMRVKAAKWLGGTTGDAATNHGGWGSPSTYVLQATLGGNGNPANNSIAQHIWSGSELSAIRKEFSTQIEAVEFNLGSENYGAQYYVDICYRGPQIDYINSPGSMTGYGFSATGWVGVTDLDIIGGGRTYTGLARPTLETKIICDNQDSKHAEPGGADGSTIDVMHLGEATGWPGWPALIGLTGGYEAGSYSHLFTANETVQPYNSNWITLHTGAPRYCKTRYLFKETPNSLYERAWQHHDARFVIKLKIEEMAASN
jgi:hypothetical protein